MAHIAIVGDGPGGLSAALFLAKAGQTVTVFGTDETARHYAYLHNYLGIAEISGSDFQRVARDQVTSFADVRTAPFIVNAMTGGRLMGHTKAVLFNYPPETLASDPRMVAAYTVNLANGITPQAPRDQFAELDQPFGLWIGAEDELFEPEKVAAFGRLAVGVLHHSVAAVVPDRTHLGILVSAHEFIGPWLERRVQATMGTD